MSEVKDSVNPEWRVAFLDISDEAYFFFLIKKYLLASRKIKASDCDPVCFSSINKFCV